jgi:hypothetical protein
MAQHFSRQFVPTPTDLEIVPVIAGENTECLNLTLNKDGVAVFPSISRQEWVNTEIQKDIAYSNNVQLLMGKKVALIVKGCFTYETMNEQHNTWFCYVILRNGKLSTIDNTAQCQDAHGAN